MVRLATGAIVVADRAAGAEGAVGDKGVFDCLLDADASRVAFSFEASNLVAGDTNGNVDVFVRDLSNVDDAARERDRRRPGRRWRAAAGSSRCPATGRGSRSERARHCSAGDTNMSAFDIYVRDTTAGTTFLASVGTGGVPGDGDSFSASLDDSGTMMAFVSDSTNFGFGDMNNATDAFVRFLGRGRDGARESCHRAGGRESATSVRPRPTISGDGLGVAFVSEATNLGATPPPNEAVVYLRKLSGATTEAVSRASGPGGALDTRRPVAPSLATTPSVVTWGSNSVTFGLGTPGDFDTALGRGDFDEVFRRELTGERADRARLAADRLGTTQLRRQRLGAEGGLSQRGRSLRRLHLALGRAGSGRRGARGAGLRARQRQEHDDARLARRRGRPGRELRRAPGRGDQRGRKPRRVHQQRDEPRPGRQRSERLRAHARQRGTANREPRRRPRGWPAVGLQRSTSRVVVRH